MKILFTGMTATQTGNSSKQFMTVYEPTARMLKDMGHEVTRKAVQVNEDLSQYDRIVCYLFPIEKLSATRKYAIFDVIARYREKCMIMFDDWQYYQVQKSIEVSLRGGRFWAWVDKFEFCNDTDKLIIKSDQSCRKRIEETAEALSKNLSLPVLYPMFPWGKKENIKIATTGEVLTYDMNRYAMEYAVDIYNLKPYNGPKTKSWIMGSMFDQEQYVIDQGFKWPVHHFGYKKKNVFVPESILCELYQKTWGIISHRYSKLNNDGWWRARWIHALVCGNIIWSYDAETEGLSTSFFYDLHDIEDSDDERLKMIAKEQYDAVTSTFIDSFESCEILDSLVAKKY